MGFAVIHRHGHFHCFFASCWRNKRVAKRQMVDLVDRGAVLVWWAAAAARMCVPYMTSVKDAVLVLRANPSSAVDDDDDDDADFYVAVDGRLTRCLMRGKK